MLGRLGLHEHLYVPRLAHQERVAPPGSKFADSNQYNLYKLGWDKVDRFKKKEYQKWVLEHWADKFPVDKLGDTSPDTLPPKYDAIVKGMVYAISHDYMAEIQHFTQLYLLERARVRKFDTCIRDMCLGVSAKAISCAFKLLVDCTYDEASGKWLRDHPDVDRRLLACLLTYKFWREATGSGLVWGKSGLDELNAWSDLIMQKGAVGSDSDHVKTAIKYRRCLDEIKTWEMDQEKYREFVTVGEAVRTFSVECQPQDAVGLMRGMAAKFKKNRGAGKSDQAVDE